MIMVLISFLPRAIIIVAFAISLASKMFDMRLFKNTIVKFRLVPGWASQVFAYFIIMGELFIIITMIIGGKLMPLGYLLAILLLMIFSIALFLALVRRIDTSCNCFGLSEDTISIYDIVRNIGFILASIIGYDTSLVSYDKLDPIAFALVGIVAVFTVVTWINLKNVIKFLLNS